MTRVAVVVPDELGRQVIRLTDIPDGSEGLTALQGLVGGYIEHVTLQPRVCGMYVHEEGLIREMPFNALASILYAASGGVTPICGPAVLVGGPDLEGNDTDVPMTMIHVFVARGMTVVGP